MRHFKSWFAWLRATRAQVGMTQEELAHLTHSAASSIRNWELETVKRPSLEKQVKIEKALQERAEARLIRISPPPQI